MVISRNGGGAKLGPSRTFRDMDSADCRFCDWEKKRNRRTKVRMEMEFSVASEGWTKWTNKLIRSQKNKSTEYLRARKREKRPARLDGLRYFKRAAVLFPPAHAHQNSYAISLGTRCCMAMLQLVRERRLRWDYSNHADSHQLALLMDAGHFRITHVSSLHRFGSR